MDIEKILSAKLIKVSYIETEDVDKFFVKSFRNKFDLSETALANILQVNVNDIRDWEQGFRPVMKTATVLLKLIWEDSSLLERVCKKEEIIGDLSSAGINT